MMTQEQKQFKLFDDFTNLYSLSKTLRFELKPVGKTNELLNEQRVFEKDKQLAENYEKIKKYFNLLHRKFIRESLFNFNNINFSNYQKLYYNYVKNNKGNKSKQLHEIREERKKLRKQIVDLFNKNAQEWNKKYKQKGIKIKKNKLEILFEKKILDILKFEFPVNEYPDVEYINFDGKKKNIFDSFKNFTTYFSSFHESRKNFYKANGISSAIPTRIIEDNLQKFIKNIDLYTHNKKKIKFSKNEKNIFNLSFYNKCFLQQGIDEYNRIIGIINSKINKYRQNTKDKIPFLKILYKQILEDIGKQQTDQDDFIEIKNNEEVFEVLKQFIKHNENNNQEFKKIFNSFIKNQSEYDLEKIYLAKRFINTISSKWFQDWSLFGGLFLEKDKKRLEDFISLIKIKQKLEQDDIKAQDLFKEDKLKKANYSKSNYDIFFQIWKNEFNEIFKEYNHALEEVEKMIKKDNKYTNKKKFKDNNEIEIQKDTIKKYADSALSIYQMMKYFWLVKGKEKLDNQYETEDKFYNDYNTVMNKAKTWLYYNEFRNFLTKKPFNEDKIKLNFENGTLLDGWDKNKESNNYGVILRKNNKYYLGLMLKESNKLFNDKYKKELKKNIERGSYEKMYCKEIPKPFRMIPKCLIVPFFDNKKNINRNKNGAKKLKEFGIDPTDKFLMNYKKNLHKKGDNFDKNYLFDYINFIKNAIPKYPNWKHFRFKLKDTKFYDNLNDFYNDIEKNSWIIWFERISEGYINKKIKEGKLYLFQIYNKDFSDKRTGRKNLHTLYFENIFRNDNKKSCIFKLNGGAEIFFRKKSLNLNKEIKEKKKTHNIIKSKRYTEDKILFHLPITLNFTSETPGTGYQRKYNYWINNLINNNNKIKIIGIDRGENNLAYYSVINQKGEIIDINSLNTVNEIDYYEKLEEKEKNINIEQKSWQTIENIKELKEGYLSQVIRKICDLALEHNAIIIFEDLSIGFKRGRQKIKKQVYQKLELALINKLNYLVNKKTKLGQAGHYLKAYQLAPKTDNFKDIGKQTGIVFYTSPSYTSNTCPNCGFRKNFKFVYKNKGQFERLMDKVKIFYEINKNRFKIDYEIDSSEKNQKNRNKDNELFKGQKKKKHFVIYTDVKRIKWHNKNTNYAKVTNKDEKIIDNKSKRGVIKEYNINGCLKNLFVEKGIDITKNNIINQILANNFKTDFYKKLCYYLNLLLVIRNSVSGANIDYIECPSCHFHSDKRFKNKKWNGDANGAYNIARKGILILKKIRQFSKNNKGDLNKISWKDLAVNIKEWDKFVQK